MKCTSIYSFIYYLSLVLLSCTEAEQSIKPTCLFDKEHDITLICNNLTDDDILKEKLSVFADSEIQIFKVLESDLTFLPSDSDVFNDTRTLHIIQSSLTYIFADVPPPKLDTVIMDDVEFQFGMNWEYFEDVRNVRNIFIRNVDIPDLDTEFERSVGRRLGRLMLKNTNTSHLGEKVFKNFVYLTDLRIESAEVEELERNMFSRPAVLRILSFEDNKISFLPKNLFAEMPNLRIVDFSYNFIKEISISLFRIIRNLDYLSFEENPLHCNCNMRWIVWRDITWEETFSRQIKGVCGSPLEFAGVELRDLTTQDFERCPSDNFVKSLKRILTVQINYAHKINKV